MVANSALAGDPPDGRWGDKKGGNNGGWGEKKTRWREDEREGVRSGSYGGQGGGWNHRGNHDGHPGGRGHPGGFPQPNQMNNMGNALIGEHSGAPGMNQSGMHHGGWNDHGAGVAGRFAKHQSTGEPSRPTGGKGFSMGRGRGGGGGFHHQTPGAGAPQMGSHFGGPSERVGLGGIVLGSGAPGGYHNQNGAPIRTALSGGVPPLPQPAEPIKRHGPVKFKYSHGDLRSVRSVLGQSAPLPQNVDPDSVPLVTVKPGDAMWELTVEGSRSGAAARMGREWANPTNGMHGMPLPVPKGSQPEWAMPSGNGPSHLGAIPKLTPEEQARFNPAQSSWLTGGSNAEDSLGGALESEGENTNRGGGVTGDPDVDDNDGTEVNRGAELGDALSQAANGDSNATANQNLGPITYAPWIYKDPSGTHQGPFLRQDLLEWHGSGYFPLDLPLRPADAPPDMPFVPLAEMLECGWRYPGPRIAAEMRAESDKQAQQAQQAQQQQHQQQQLQQQQMKQQMEQEQKRLEQDERRRVEQEERAEAQRHAQEQLLERQRKQQQMEQTRGTGWHGAPPNANQPRSLADLEGSNYNATSPTQGQPNLLANLFGGGGGEGGAVPPPPGGGMSLADLERQMGGGDALPMAPQPGSFDSGAAWGGQEGQHNDGWVSAPTPGMHEIQAQQQLMEPASPPSQPAWGANSSSAPKQKSLAKIQREEEERAAVARREQEQRAEANPGLFAAGGGPMATAWGGGAASQGPSLAQIQAEELRQSAARAQQQQQQREQPRAGGAWAGGASAAMRAAPPGQASGPPAGSSNGPSGKQTPVGGNFWDSLPPSNDVPKAVHQLRPQPAASPQPLQLSPSPTANFKDFCRAEMKALNDSDDLTLVDFLLSLPSAGEVTEYVQLYLGTTARAAAFGNELIRIKRANPGMSSVDDAPSSDKQGEGEFTKPKRRGKK